MPTKTGQPSSRRPTKTNQPAGDQPTKRPSPNQPGDQIPAKRPNTGQPCQLKYQSSPTKCQPNYQETDQPSDQLPTMQSNKREPHTHKQNHQTDPSKQSFETASQPVRVPTADKLRAFVGQQPTNPTAQWIEHDRTATKQANQPNNAPTCRPVPNNSLPTTQPKTHNYRKSNQNDGRVQLCGLGALGCR